MTRAVGDFDYGVSKSKIALALSSTSHDQGDRVTRLIKTKKAMSSRFSLVSRSTQSKTDGAPKGNRQRKQEVSV